MNRQEILSSIQSLAKSQGCYGSLYQFLTNGSDEAEEYMTELERQKFNDAVDLVMYIECQLYNFSGQGARNDLHPFP